VIHEADLYKVVEEVNEEEFMEEVYKKELGESFTEVIDGVCIGKNNYPIEEKGEKYV
jgi:hypothetical protein